MWDKLRAAQSNHRMRCLHCILAFPFLGETNSTPAHVKPLTSELWQVREALVVGLAFVEVSLQTCQREAALSG